MSECVLLGDIGATNARFALAANGSYGPIKTLNVADFSRFEDALDVFLGDAKTQRRVKQARFAVAGPVEHDRCAMTNSSWVIDAHELKSAFGWTARVLNDFEAVALSLPTLAKDDLVRIGGGKAVAGAPMAALGPGTGLGVACLVPNSHAAAVIPSEGGHASLAAGSDREDAVVKYLRQKFGHASAERAVSGSGLENLYRAVADLDGRDVASLDAPEITNRALEGDCPAAVEALTLFCAFLGSFAGNIALTFGAKGGVYLAGGISPRIVDFLDRSDFRERFEAKGRFRRYLAAIPSYVIVHPAAAFVGLKHL